MSDFWNGQKGIRILDPNITACRDKRELFKQYRETGAILDFTQGLDIRILNDADMDDLNHMRLRTLHFAWDNPNDDLKPKFCEFAKAFRRKSNIGMVYILTNYENCSVEEHIERAIYRIDAVAELGYDPYLMIYNKPGAAKIIVALQRWCNNKIIFKSCPKFEDYKAYTKGG